MTIHGAIRADRRWREECICYSICTIVTRPDQYAEMIESYKSRGFDAPDCEFLYLDNSSGNAFDAYTGYNIFLNVARGQFIILCHQDVVLVDNGRASLDAALDELTKLDLNWAACGNAGGNRLGRVTIRITDPHGADKRIGHFPAKVRSLDENFVIIRRSANLALSGDLEGFHFYGTDICLIADVLGYSCYVIDFHLCHKGAGVLNEHFFSTRKHLIRKYQRAFRSRWVTTTCTTLFISGLPLLGALLSGTIALLVDRFKGVISLRNVRAGRVPRRS